MKHILRTLAVCLPVALPVTAVTVPAMLAGCASSSTVNASQAITDAGIIVNGIQGVYQSFVTLYPSAVSPAQQASVAKTLAAAQAAQVALQGASANLTTATTLSGIEADVNVVLGAITQVAPGVVPPQISAGIMAAQVLLPLIEATVAQIQNPAAPVKVGAVVGAMSPGQARLVLMAAAQK